MKCQMERVFPVFRNHRFFGQAQTVVPNFRKIFPKWRIPFDFLPVIPKVFGKWKAPLYLKASGKINENEDVQCAILLHVIVEEAIEIYNTFQFATEEDGVRNIPILGVQATTRRTIDQFIN